jgi:hypothetical protein
MVRGNERHPRVEVFPTRPCRRAADIRVLNDTGELIRQLVLDPTRDYQVQNQT